MGAFGGSPSNNGPAGGLVVGGGRKNTAAPVPTMPAFPGFGGGSGATALGGGPPAGGPVAAAFTGKDGTRYDSAGNAISGPGGAALPAAKAANAAAPGGGPGMLTNNVQSSPDVLKMQQQYQQQLGTIQGRANTADPNQKFLIDKYKERLGNDETQRLEDRAAGATRDVQAAQRPMLDRAAAMSGAGPGAGAVQQSDAAIRASAKANADIQAGRSRDIDAMVLGGQGIMNAPGQRQLSYDQLATGLTQANPALGIEQNKLGQGQLGLSQWVAQNNAAQSQQQLQAQQNSQALQAWMQALSMYSR